MVDDTRTEPEWHDAIAHWDAACRRIARIAAIAGVTFVFVPLVLWLVAPPAPSPDPAPMPAWRSEDFLDGRTTRQFEKHVKESSWLTFVLRGLHDAAMEALGIPPPGGMQGQFDFEIESGELIPLSSLGNALERGFIVAVPWEQPRPRTMIAPNQTFWLRYRNNDVLRRDWFDGKGRVKVHLNRFGMRDRDDLEEAKPAGERRILCLGDSMVFGWGVPEESCWVRVVESDLRAEGRNVRTINCGAVGTVCVDEYWWALKNRFVAFDPDVVVVTLCLNDLVPSHGLSLMAPPERSGGLGDVLKGRSRRNPLDLDPAFDWVEALLKVPQGEAEAGNLCNHDRPFQAMWSQGVPQSSLREARAFCDARGIRLAVVLWPFLQGLGPGRSYPFGRLHDMVATFCREEGLPFLDVLPLLRAIPQEDLWVTPADMHPNPRAHRIAATAIRALVEPLLRR